MNLNCLEVSEFVSVVHTFAMRDKINTHQIEIGETCKQNARWEKVRSNFELPPWGRSDIGGPCKHWTEAKTGL